jgi:hypothetical protein
MRAAGTKERSGGGVSVLKVEDRLNHGSSESENK